jgi:hypothetical protein
MRDFLREKRPLKEKKHWERNQSNNKKKRKEKEKEDNVRRRLKALGIGH